MKNFLYGFIEGQIHFGLSRGAKVSLALDEPKLVALHSKSNTTSKHAPQLERIYGCCIQNNQWKSWGTNSPRKVSLSSGFTPIPQEISSQRSVSKLLMQRAHQ